MGQTKALTYKYWILTKRSKVSFACQAFTPLLCLFLIRLIIYLTSKIKL